MAEDIKTKVVTPTFVKVKMKVISASPNGVMEDGKVYRVSKEWADELIAGNYAEVTNEPVYNPG